MRGRNWRRTPDGTWVDCRGRPARRRRQRKLELAFGPGPWPLPPDWGDPGFGDPSGDREPRTPRPTLPSMAAAVEPPSD